VRTAQHYRGGTEPPAQSKADQPGAAQGANGSKPASGWRRLLGRETFHTLRQTNPAVYDELRRAMLQVVHTGPAAARYTRLYPKATGPERIEEMLADMHGDFMDDPKLWVEVFRASNRPFVERLYHSVRQVFNSLYQRLTRGGTSYTTGSLIADLDAARKAFAKAYVAWQAEPHGAQEFTKAEMARMESKPGAPAPSSFGANMPWRVSEDGRFDLPTKGIVDVFTGSTELRRAVEGTTLPRTANSKWVLSAALLAAVLGLAYTSFYLWRTFRPNPLDLAISRARQSADSNRAVEAPISPAPRGEQTDPVPAVVDRVLPADKPVTSRLPLSPSQLPVTHTGRIEAASIVATPRVEQTAAVTAGPADASASRPAIPALPVSPSQTPVTHTKRVEAAPTARAAGISQDPGRGLCTEAVAALGLCNPGAKGGSN
jgi:hypothetical protein